VSSALEGGGEEDGEDLLGQARTNHSRAHAQNVGVVVHAGHARAEGLGAERRADAQMPIRGHGHTQARPADEQPQLAMPRRHVRTDGVGEVRIVDGAVARCAAVLDVEATLTQQRRELVLQIDARMIGADGDASAHHERSA